VRISLMNRVYVMLDIYKLQNQFLSLQYRTRAMRAMKPEIPVAEAEGYELSPLTSGADSEKSTSSAVAKSPEMNEKVVALKKEWRGWQLASIKNVYVILHQRSKGRDSC
jgi:hypothetical protein